MTRIANHSIVRDTNPTTAGDRGSFNTTWAYCGQPVDPNVDRLAWQYHTNARLIKNDRGVSEKVMENAPLRQEYSPIRETRVEHNHALTPALYWPSTNWIAIATNMDAYINYNHVDGWNGERSTAWFYFKEPLPPTFANLGRSQATLTWTIQPRANEMGGSTAYDRKRTRYYKQRITKGQSWPNVPRYDQGGTKTEGTGNITVTHTESTVSPTTPVKVRVLAQNDGFTGASTQATQEHTFSIPLKPTITAIQAPGGMRGSGATILVRSNSDGNWYPVDQLILERQVSSECVPQDNQWQRVSTFNNAEGIKKLASIYDGLPGRLPPADKATWYRVRAWHDEESNNSTSNVLVSTYTNAPSAPTISSAEWETGGIIRVSVTKNSQMRVKTYVYVQDLSVSGLPKVVNDYEVPEGSLNNFTIKSGGVDKTFEADHLYKVGVYNKVYNAPDLFAKYGETPKSTDATMEVRGSVAAIAKAKLKRPTITDVELNSSGTSALLVWTIGQDELTITYDDVGTLIEWTDADGGWNSTESPKSYKLSDAKKATGDGVASNEGFVTIEPLEEGVTYQVRVMRYVTLDNEDGYSDADYTTITPWSTPQEVTLSGPGYVLPGESVRYTWTFTDFNDTPQSSAILTVNGFPYGIEGSAGSYVLDVPESLAGETLTATVRVACNGGYSDPSAEVVTTVAARPTCTLALPSCETSTDYGGLTLTALPLTCTVGGSGDTFRVRVTSNGGAMSPEPAGGRELAAGEVVATEVFSGAGTYEVDGSMIIGGGNYDVECVCVDTTTGMESEPVVLGFTALWEDAAVIPSGTVEIEDGMAYITPVEGADAPEGEACRIWRKVADGYVLACENAIWGERHLDRVPAYGSDELAYVIEAVSADGDHKWAEVPYTLSGTDARITFGGQTVSLPWNLQPKSSYAKGFERRAHMDGHRAGFWEPGVDRDWALSSGYLRDDRAHTDELREVGRYDGLCYVRGPRGVGFAANVDVDMSLTYDSAEANVDITCAEVADDGTYAIVVEPRDEDAEDEGEGA